MRKAFFWAGIVAVATAALALVVPALPQNPQTQNAPLYAVNAKYANGTTPGYWPTQQSIPNGSGGTIAAATGLNINIGPGTSNCGSGTIITYAGGTLALTASTTNYVYLNTSASCAVAVKTTAFVSADIPIAVIVTNGTGITTNGITDVRTPFNVPPSPAPSGVTSVKQSATVACNPNTSGSCTGAVTLNTGSGPCAIGSGGAVGAFTDSGGVIKSIVCIANDSGNLITPNGATQLQLGTNDNKWVDDGGSFTMSVSKNGGSSSNVSVLGTAMPWNQSVNASFPLGLNDGTSPTVAISGLSVGDSVRVVYVSGSVTSPGWTATDANGWLTYPPGAACAGGPTGATPNCGGFGLIPTYYLYHASSTGLPSTNNVLKGDGSGGALAATPGTDYVVPAGNVATATALAAAGTPCSGSNFAKGVDASGNAVGCATPAGGAAGLSLCADVSGSGTNQSCTLSPTTTFGADLCFIYKTTTANTGALTLTVNGNALPVKKWLGTTLVSGDVPIGQGGVACVNSSATAINVMTIGNAPNGSVLTHCDDGVTTPGTITCTEPFAVVASGASQQSYTYNGTPVVPGGGTTAVVGADSSGRGVLSNAGGTAFTIRQTIASGTSSMGTSAITSGTCATAVTVSISGLASSDVILWNPSGTTNPTTTTGYQPSAAGSLYIWAVPTTNTLSFYVCNNTGSSVTPGAMTLNWSVTR